MQDLLSFAWLRKMLLGDHEKGARSESHDSSSEPHRFDGVSSVQSDATFQSLLKMIDAFVVRYLL